MDSSDLRIYGFTSWIKLSELEKNKGHGIPEKKSGVYVFRLDRKFGRLVGESDILYIGISDDLRKKIYNDYILGEDIRKDYKTIQRIHTYLDDLKYLDKVEVSYITLEDLKNLIKELKDLEPRSLKEKLIFEWLEDLKKSIKNLEELINELIEDIIKELIKELTENLIEDLEDSENLDPERLAELINELIIKKLEDIDELKNLKEDKEDLKKLINKSIKKLNNELNEELEKLNGSVKKLNELKKSIENLKKKKTVNKEELDNLENFVKDLNEELNNLIDLKKLNKEAIEELNNLKKSTNLNELENLIEKLIKKYRKKLLEKYEKKLKNKFKIKLLEKYEEDHHELPPWNRIFK